MTGVSHADDGQAPGRAAEVENPLERLRLLSGDDDAIASFLDELEVSSPREREMLAELARRTPLERPDRFDADLGGRSRRSRASAGTASTARRRHRRSARSSTPCAGWSSSSPATSSSRT